MKIYEFLYNSCIYESAAGTMSMHRTKAGAYKAMNKWLNERFMKEYDERIKYGKDRSGLCGAWKVGTHEWWGIGEQELCE